MIARRMFSTTVMAAVILDMVFSVGAQQSTVEAVRIDNDDLGGVVTGAKGPEAGVWVIAETNSLPTKFSKTVVTDDRGRYLVPDLPKAEYEVWVRGYGLVDSPKVKAAPGKILNLTAVAAPNPRAAADYYPAGYWLSLVQPPAKSEFPGTGPSGNGISPNIKTQAEWLRLLKSGGCTACHQLGNKATREISKSLGTFRFCDARMGTSSPVRPGGRQHGRRPWSARQGACLNGACRLDQPDRGRRNSSSAAPSARRGAKRRDHPVGLGRPESVSSRRGLH